MEYQKKKKKTCYTIHKINQLNLEQKNWVEISDVIVERITLIVKLNLKLQC